MKIKILSGKLIDGTGAEPSEPSEIILENGRIIAINQEVSSADNASFDKIIDAAGKTICPGLINAHLHLYMDAGPSPLQDLDAENGHLSLLKAADRCRQLVMNGITTVRDMGAKDLGILALKKAIEEGLVEGPRILVCGKALAMTGGHAPALSIAVDGPNEIRRTVRMLLDFGADFIKLFATGGFGKPDEQLDSFELTTKELRTAAQTAHAAGKTVAVHAYGIQGIRNAVDAGADSIEHAVFLDEKVIEKIIEKGIFIVPTLANTYRQSNASEKDGVPTFISEKAKQVFPIMMDKFRLAYEAGAKIVAGTDGGSWMNPHYDLTTELKLRGEIGVPTKDLIKMATKTAAECLNLDNTIGTIEVGKRSDIIIVDGDPLNDISTLQNIDYVFIGENYYSKRFISTQKL